MPWDRDKGKSQRRGGGIIRHGERGQGGRRGDRGRINSGDRYNSGGGGSETIDGAGGVGGGRRGGRGRWNPDGTGIHRITDSGIRTE